MAMASGEDDSDAMVMAGVRNRTRVKEQIHPNDIIIIISLGFRHYSHRRPTAFTAPPLFHYYIIDIF